MDSLRSCFTTEMYLWGRDRPPVPVRWFFAEPDAEVFPYVHSFWNVDWEMDKGYKGDNDLIGERGKYANGSTFVHYPGKHFHGPAQAFIDGGRWGIDPPLTTGPDGAIAECRIPADSPPGWTVMSGGQAQGGAQHACGLLGYGMLGGQAQGGQHMCTTGLWVRMSGGQAQGGTHPVPPPYVVMMSGGQAQGGTMPGHGGATVTMSGGEAQGGEHVNGDHYFGRMSGGEGQGGTQPLSDGLQFTMTGGQAQGGLQTAHGDLNVIMSGGQAQGGAMDASGDDGEGGECGPVPTIVTSHIRPVRDFDDEIFLDTDPVDGDLFLLFIWQGAFPAAIVGLEDWFSLAEATNADAPLTLRCWWKRWHTGDSHGVHITGEGGVPIQLLSVNVRGAGDPFAGDTASGSSNPIDAPGVDVGTCPALLFMAAGTIESGTNLNTPAGMTDEQPSPAVAPMSVWSESLSAGGATGDRTTIPDDGNEWAAFLVVCPPI